MMMMKTPLMTVRAPMRGRVGTHKGVDAGAGVPRTSCVASSACRRRRGRTTSRGGGGGGGDYDYARDCDYDYKGGGKGREVARRSVRCASSSSPSSSSSSSGLGDPNAISLDVEAVKKWFGKATEAKWDAPAKEWRDFFAMRPIASVLEMDSATERVNASEIESHGLNFPTCRAEALARAKANGVRFRQNYGVIACGMALLGSECIAFFLALISFYAYMALSSDNILGELSLATKGKLQWNEKVVAGASRATLKNVTMGVALVLFLLSDATANTYAVLRSVGLSSIIAFAHAVMRPIDLKGTLADIVKGFRGAKSKEELKDVAAQGLKSVQTWWSNRKPMEPTPVILVQKNSGSGGRASSANTRTDTGEPAPKRENADGAIDVEAREARERKQLSE